MKIITHNNQWYWGESIDLISDNAAACVVMSFERDNPGVCYISGLSVIPECRKQGYATSLMLTCEQICKEKGIFRIDLSSVLIDFVQDFYKKLGYIPIREDDSVLKMNKFLK
ncbi:MAG: GNAT family N-acetyltransferase [Agathobacter sp.]